MAVLSTVTGNIVLEVQKKLPHVAAHVIASDCAIIGGSIVCFIGLVRLGWIVDFISLTSITAFITGSALNIAVGQVPTMMGITGFSTRDPTYLVTIHILKHLGRTKIDAAMGLTALFLLYLIRFTCNRMAKRFPSHRKLWFFISTLRTAFVILLYTMISWLVNRHRRKNPRFAILGTVPRGFQDAGAPPINKEIIRSFSSQIPALVIVMLIEHISIAKSFGRVNNYTINPSQELVAIGVTNLLGPFLGAYPATGSFSRTAIKSKAGVRTPLAGVITAIVVLLAIYALPAVFFYIPSASLSAVIIHAVGDLITPPNTVYKFWRISPLEVVIFFAGVIVTVFSSIEDGIYTTICVSAALLLYRIVKARGRFLGKVKIHSVIGDHLLDDGEPKNEYYGAKGKPNGNGSGTDSDELSTIRNAYLPIDHRDGSNPAIEFENPYPGIFIYRFSEGFNFPNANHYLDGMVSTIFKETRRTNPNTYGKPGVSQHSIRISHYSTNKSAQDRPWNDPGPRKGKEVEPDDRRPTLKAIILDFSSVNNVDITSVQNLIDVRNQLDRYASPETVEWHFASINNRWTKRALASAGFGYPAPAHQEGELWHRWKPVFSVAELGGFDSAAGYAEWQTNREIQRNSITAGNTEDDVEAHANGKAGDGVVSSKERRAGKSVVTHGVNRPLFHVDLTVALQSAIHNVERREAQGGKVIAEDVADLQEH